MTLEERYQRCNGELAARAQQHVLQFWDALDLPSRELLLSDLEAIPWELVDRLTRTHVLQTPHEAVPTDLQPAKVYRRAPAPGQEQEYERAQSLGAELLAAGKVAAFTVAGGQGSRLGVDGPKGAVAVTPVKRKSLFQLFAEMVLAARRRYDTSIPWYIMTSRVNHEQTEAFFQQHDYFGLPSADVVFFRQGMLPCFDFTGKLLLAEKGRLAVAPDGHGGSLKALSASGALRDMKIRGVEIASYFQVDNPLVRPFDELFLGLHRLTGAEMSAKVTSKADDFEKVGNVCVAQGSVVVVEYSDFPDNLARAKNPDGSRRFDVGNLAMHLLDVAFVERIVSQHFQLPFHRAEKAVGWVDAEGRRRDPGEPNAVKLETFVFDALPLAKDTLLLEIDRREEFSPVKNASGVDSLETAIRDQIRRAANWLAAAGVDVPRCVDGEPQLTLEIAPSLAMSADELRDRRFESPSLTANATVYLS